MEQENVICPACNGSGASPGCPLGKECMACDGLGKVDERLIEDGRVVFKILEEV